MERKKENRAIEWSCQAQNCSQERRGWKIAEKLKGGEPLKSCSNNKRALQWKESFGGGVLSIQEALRF